MTSADYETRLDEWKKAHGIRDYPPLRHSCSRVIIEDDDDRADDDDDDNNGMESARCNECGGDGFVEYNDAGPSYWGEDCPSERNHLVTCQSCHGTGIVKP